MRIEDVLDLFDGVKKASGQYLVRCPAHDDDKASLAIRENERGLAFYCHAGCDNHTILERIGLHMSDLFAEEQTRKRTIVTTYDYVDEVGTLLYQVVRYDPKDFRQRTPKGNDWTWSLNGVRRVPYLLPELLEDPATPVFIVEGEKDAHTLHAKGFTVTTNAGGANTWYPEWAPYFADRLVYLVPDQDEKGLEHMLAVGRMLSDAAAEIRTIHLPAKDATEFFLKHGEQGFALFNQHVENAPLWDAAPAVIEPEFAWPDAPIHEGLIGEIVTMIEPHTEADPVGLFMDLLVTFGNCVGPCPHYLVGATRHRLNLFVALCGETASARKGTGHDWTIDIFSKVDERYVQDCILGGLASGEGLIHAVRDARTRIGKDEKVVVLDDGVTDKRRLFYEPELAGRTFTAAKREGSTLSAILRQAWDGNNLAVATKTNDDKASGAHISVLGHATVDELLKTLRETDITGGFANRFMFFVVKRRGLMAIQTRPDETRLRRLCDRLRVALDAARRITQVMLTDEGTTEWKNIYSELNAENDRTEKEIQFTARGAPQVLRMSLILAMVEGKRQIDACHLKQAMKLWIYSAKSVEFMLGDTTGSLPPDFARLYRVLQHRNGLTRSEIQKACHWNGAVAAGVIGKFLQAKMGYEETVATGGRPRKVIYIWN